MFYIRFGTLNTIHLSYNAKVLPHLIDILDSKRSFGRSKLEKNVIFERAIVGDFNFEATSQYRI